MYIGISYQLKNNEVNRQLQALGSAVIFSGATRYYFTNPIVAFAVKNHLGRVNKRYKYSLQQLPKDIIDKKVYIKSYEDFLNYADPDRSTNTENSIELEK